MLPTLRHYLALYRRLIGAQIRSQMQYRFSFYADMLGTMVITGLDVVMLVVLLARFQAIGGWTLPEVMFLYGTSAVSYSLAEMLVGAFDDFDRDVVSGDFDRVLLRPLPIFFQMVTGRFPTRRLGRLAQGLIALVVSLALLRPAWPAANWVFFAVMIVSGGLLFAAILIMGATAAFWSPQTNEAVNIFTYGGQFMSSYPMHIYQGWLISIFTFVIPMAFINYYPTLYLFGRTAAMGVPAFVPFLSPLVALVAFAASLRVWRIGVRHYHSTGS